MSDFKKYDKDDLKHLQKLELMILKDVVSICDKYNLDYYLYGGTLLGAVRHKGFIPWDDDIDIAMFREDYDKLLEVLDDELDDKYEILSFKHQHDYFLSFAKISLKNTIFSVYWSSNTSVNQGIFIDIFPLDNSSNSGFKRKIHRVKCRIFGYLFISSLFEIKSNTTLKRIINKFMHSFLTKIPISKEFYKNKFIKFLKEFNDNGDTELLYDHSAVMHPGIFYRKDFKPYILLEFEGIKFKAPNNYDNFLTMVYGDYMKLPPKNKRYNHAPIELDFGKY